MGGVSLGYTPLNVLQMLWINLVMDILASIALCTEPYQKDKNGARISRRHPLMLPE